VLRVSNQQGSPIHRAILPLEHSGKAADGMLGTTGNKLHIKILIKKVGNSLADDLMVMCCELM
jgi:hypothetical protein